MTSANVKEKNTKAYHKWNILHKHHRLLHLFALWNLFSAPFFTIILILQVSKVKLIQNDLCPDQVPGNTTSLKLSITAFVGCHLTIPSSEWIQIQTAFCKWQSVSVHTMKPSLLEELILGILKWMTQMWDQLSPSLQQSSKSGSSFLTCREKINN